MNQYIGSIFCLAGVFVLKDQITNDKSEKSEKGSPLESDQSVKGVSGETSTEDTRSKSSVTFGSEKNLSPHKQQIEISVSELESNEPSFNGDAQIETLKFPKSTSEGP